MKDTLDDNLLIEELRKRLEKKDRLLKEQSEMIEKMEELNTRLRNAEKVKSGFLSNIRNEINNPLTSILGLSGVIKNDSMSSPNVQKWAAHINREAFNLDFQLRNIFAAAEIEAGEVNANSSQLDIIKIVNRAITYLLPRSTHHDVGIYFEQSNDKILFSTDSYLLHLICVNLISNAIEFSPKGGEVRISVSANGTALVVSVEDDGPRIPTEDQRFAFERFNQLEKGTTKKHQGHGLGLSIVKEFTDLMHGSVTINCEVSTRLEVILPKLATHMLEKEFLPSDDEILFGETESF